jgi:hypothetical protein
MEVVGNFLLILVVIKFIQNGVRMLQKSPDYSFQEYANVVPYFYKRQRFEYKKSATRCPQRVQHNSTPASPKIATTD